MHSNFITPPDYVETVLIINATNDQMAEYTRAFADVKLSYNVYFYNEEMNEPDWFSKVSNQADVILDANLTNPLDYFNK
jgi:hypothetical protein